jgi:two-component system, cell cycle sensor histidine kinase and response regulator CckA
VGNMSITPVEPIAPFNPAHPQKPVILLVEDESIVREVTREVLEHAGYQVLESGGPLEALRLAAEHRGRIGLLLSDVVMPEMNGLDLALRIQEIQPRVTTVFISGYADDAVLHKAVRDPLSTYIQKPFTVDVLLARVAEALAKSPTAGHGAALSDLSA